MRRLAIQLICLFPCLAQTQPGARGVIAGSLAGDDGTAILGARIGVLLLTPSQLKRGGPQTLWAATSGPGGAFRVNGLPPGRYKICAEGPDNTWLNPCEWGLKPEEVTLTAAQPSASVRVVMAKGATLRIRVDDPTRVVSLQEGKVAGAHLLVGVATDAFSFRLAPVVSQDATGRYHEVVIPFGVTAKVVARSSVFRLSDGNGAPLSTSAVIPVTVATGQAAPLIRVVVTGGSR